MIFYMPVVFTIFAAIIFILANDWLWFEGWLFIGVFICYAFLYTLYALIKDPEIFLKRAKYTTDDFAHKSFSDKKILLRGLVLLAFMVIYPALEHAAGNQPLPWMIELVGFLGVIVGLIGLTYVNIVNRYASKGLVIHKDHELITAGPYQYVRHPLYALVIPFILGTPLLLGSFIGFLASWLFIPLLIYRIQIEEQMLIDHLPGYSEYMQQVPYRLIPKVY
jgi:protein-S-isoprenylcysteine O-methyltransferase Ste14